MHAITLLTVNPSIFIDFDVFDTINITRCFRIRVHISVIGRIHSLVDYERNLIDLRFLFGPYL